jgi:hypothetical protein
MLQMTVHLTRSSCLWTFQLLGFEVFQVRLQKKCHCYKDIHLQFSALIFTLKVYITGASNKACIER